MSRAPFNYGRPSMSPDEPETGAMPDEAEVGRPATPEEIGKCLNALELKVLGKSNFDSSGLYTGAEYAAEDVGGEMDEMDETSSGLTA